MDEIEMMIERDVEVGTWDIGPAAPGPAGAARIDLSDTLTVAVDLATPDAIGLFLAEDFETGRVAGDDLERVALIAGSDVATAVAGRAVSVDPDASTVSRAALAGFAAALDGWRHARAELVRDLWAAEMVVAASEAPDQLGLDRFVAPHRAAGIAAVREVAGPGGPRLDGSALDSLARLAGAVGVDLPTLEPPAPRAERSVALERVESARVHFGELVDGRSRVGWMMLDPTVSSRRIFALEDPATVTWDEIDHVLRIRCRLSPRAYFPEVETYWVRAYRSVTGTLLGLGQLDPLAGADRTAEAESFLGGLTAEEWDGVVVDVTDHPEARPPGLATRSARVAADLGRAALAAERLGLTAEAADAWRQCASHWERLGDDDRHQVATTRAASPALAHGPFTADLIGSIRI